MNDFLDRMHQAAIDVFGEAELIRTDKQNSAEHLWFRQIAEALNDAGYHVNDRQVIRIDIPFTEYTVKEEMFKRIAAAMFGKDSTAKLTTKETQEAAEVLSRHLGEKFGVHVPWPEQ